MNEMNSPFETRPVQIAVAESALPDFKRYAKKHGKSFALDALIDMHLKHVHQLVHEDMLNVKQGSVIVTDIPNTNLSVVDAHFPTLGERQVTVFTRRGVAVVFALLRRDNDSLVN